MKKMSHREFQLMLWHQALENEIPVSDIFELTPLCNLDCKMCYVHLQDPSVKEQMLDGDTWITIMDEAIQLGMMGAILTGGEAMTHPGFWKIYRHLVERGISTSVKTNGILLNEDARSTFQQYPPATIDISVYGCSRESYQVVTGHDLFETADRNIRAAKTVGLPVRLMITPSGFMKPWLDEIMEYARTLKLKTVVNTQLLDPHPNTGRNKEDFDLSLQEILTIREQAKTLFPKEYLSFEEEKKLLDKYKPEAENTKSGLRCSAGRTHFAVCWDGVMLPCITFPRELISADARRLGVKGAWNAIHEAVVGFQPPAACGFCSYKEECAYCPSSHGKAALRHQCNPVECELEQYLIDETKRIRGDIA